MTPGNPLRLTRPESPPAANESLLCTRCGATYRVLCEMRDGVQLWPSNDHPEDAQATCPWCPQCGTADERAKGATFRRGRQPTWVELRRALKEALEGWADVAAYRDAPPPERLAELRKLVGE